MNSGLTTIHQLTETGYTHLRIDFKYFEEMTDYAMYNEFKVGGAEDKYNLTVKGYNGTAGEGICQ